MEREYRRLIARPWLVKIELTRGCNLACRFCPIYALPAYSERPEYMGVGLCGQICAEIRGINDHARVELTMRGEPTLNPAVGENVAAIRAELPKSQISMFTNGVKFFKVPELVPELFDAGVNILNIDCYNNTWDRFQRLADAAAKTRPDIQVKDFRQFSAYVRHPNGHRLKVINLVPDIAQPGGGGVAVRVIHNNAGNVDRAQLQERWGISPLVSPLRKRCVRPFRELVVTYDGSVVICCHDWRAECIVGRVPQSRLADIWYGEAHWRILSSLYDRDRSGVPCNRCDYHGGYRHGLLRNPRMGDGQ